MVLAGWGWDDGGWVGRAVGDAGRGPVEPSEVGALPLDERGTLQIDWQPGHSVRCPAASSATCIRAWHLGQRNLIGMTIWGCGRVAEGGVARNAEARRPNICVG